MYKKAHEAIRTNPAREPKEPKEVFFFLRNDGDYYHSSCSDGDYYHLFQITKKRWTAKKASLSVRKNRVKNKKAYLKMLQAQQEAQ